MTSFFFLCLLFNAKQLGSTFSAISCYYDLIGKGRVPSHSIIIGIEERGHHASSFNYIKNLHE